MLTLTTQHFRYHNAVQFYEGFFEPQATVGYVTFGKAYPWSTYDVTPDVYQSDILIQDIYRGMIGGKKVLGNNVFLVLPRINWTANTVYTQYDDTSNTLYQSANGQYIYTSSGYVYRCIRNANNHPTGVGCEPNQDSSVNNGFIKTTDGYVWKYLYSVPIGSIFFTSRWIPVPQTQSIAYGGNTSINVLDGGLSAVQIINGGTGYFSSNTTARLVGDGKDAVISVTVVNSAIATVSVDATGYGYSHQNCTVQVLGAGTGANLRPILSPPGGHGYNPARELGANDVMIVATFGEVEATEGGKFTSNNDFRRIALILGPHKYGNTEPVSFQESNTAVRMTTGLVLAGTSDQNYVLDQLVYQGTDLANASYSAVAVDQIQNTLYVSEQRGTLSLDSTMKLNGVSQSGAISRQVIAVLPPELEPGTGTVGYVENRAAIRRADNQSETIRLVVSF